MSADPWEPRLAELEGARDAGDGGRLRAMLEDVWRFSFHEEREREPERWDRLFALLMRLLGHDDAPVRAGCRGELRALDDRSGVPVWDPP
jgi:hypothetical protein